MSIRSPQTKALPRILINWILLLVICVNYAQVKGMESRKLDEEKCGSCGYPSSPPPIVYPSPPPPIVYPSPPPPPPIVYESPPPPPSPKKPPSSSVYCPPPPSSSSYQYITGPPGNLYPVDENFSGASPNRRQFAMFLPLLVGLLTLLLAF